MKRAPAPWLCDHADSPDHLLPCCQAMVTLAAVDAHAEQMAAAGGGRALMEGLRALISPDNASACAWGCRAIAVLASGREGIKVGLGRLGVCEQVVAVLRVSSNHPVAARAGLEAVTALTTDQASNQNAMSAAGACEVVLSVMRALQRDQVVRLAGLEAVACLAKEHTGNQTAVGQADICTEIMAAVMVLAQAPDHHVCAAYFKVVAVLAMRHTANRLMLRPSVCIMAVSSYMTRFPNERDSQAWGCLAIYALVCGGFDNRPQPAFIGLPAISATDGPISALTHFRADAEVCHCACRALYALAVRLNLYYEPPVCLTVVLAVREHITAPLVCLWACRLMAALLNVNRTNQHNMTSMGAPRYVVRGLRQYCDSDRDVCDAACRAVIGFARDNTANQTTMRASGACEYVIKVLRMALTKKDPQLCILGCDAIRALAAEGPEAKFTLQPSAGVRWWWRQPGRSQLRRSSGSWHAEPSSY